jgi:hypothetical protein
LSFATRLGCKRTKEAGNATTQGSRSQKYLDKISGRS